MSATFKVSKSGIIEICKSFEMQAALTEAAAEKRDEANRLLRSHDPKAGEHEYLSLTKRLRKTCIGMVHTTGITTELDQKKHHTLNAINH